MLTFRQLDDLPEAVVELLAETQQTIINDMARRIARLGEVTTGTNWQALRLELLGATQEDLIRELSRALNVTEQKLIELFDEAATRTLVSDNAVFKAAGYSPVPLAENPFLQQIIQAGLAKTLGEFANLTRTTAYTATRQFERALDLAHMQIVSGAMDYQSAIKSAIRGLARDGLAAIRYPSGHTDYLDVAARRAVLTGVNQTAAEVQLANIAQMGTDLVETTAHPGARPDHMVWQGRIFSVSGTGSKYPSFYSETGYGTGPGLCGWNCRHSFFPFFEGLSDPAYTAEKLREYNDKTVTYDGKEMSLYDASQRQREIERHIRRWKREADAMDAAGLDPSYARGKVREWQATQRDFIKQTGLSRDYFRERAGAQLGVYVPPDTIKVSGFSISRSVGARAANYDILDFGTGEILHFAEGTHIQNVEIFAGKGVKTPLHDGVAEGLTRQFGGIIGGWQHAKGYGILDLGTEHRRAEVHWFQEETVGRVKFVVKRWYED